MTLAYYFLFVYILIYTVEGNAIYSLGLSFRTTNLFKKLTLYRLDLVELLLGYSCTTPYLERKILLLRGEKAGTCRVRVWVKKVAYHYTFRLYINKKLFLFMINFLHF